MVFLYILIAILGIVVGGHVLRSLHVKQVATPPANASKGASMNATNGAVNKASRASVPVMIVASTPSGQGKGSSGMVFLYIFIAFLGLTALGHAMDWYERRPSSSPVNASMSEASMIASGAPSKGSSGASMSGASMSGASMIASGAANKGSSGATRTSSQSKLTRSSTT